MRALAIVALAGCFDPKLSGHLRCAEADHWCPPPQICGADGFCGGGPIDDAAGSGLPDENIVFTSSEPVSLSMMTNHDIIAMADAECQTLGTKLRAGTYIAWLGTDPASASARLPASVGWSRVDGQPFTTSANALGSQAQVFYPPRIDDDRADVPGQRMDTAVVTQLPLADGCSTGISNTVVAGRADGDDPDWYSAVPGRTCDGPLYLYCFETDRRVSEAPPVLDPTQLYAFVTAQTYSLRAGIGQLDMDCQSAADGVMLGRKFAAFVAPSGMAASSRFVSTTRSWSRLDGVIVARPDLSAFFAPLSITEENLHIHIDVAFGASSPSDPGNDANNCMNWGSASAGIIAGRSTRSDGKAFSGSQITCTSAHLYCLEIP
jgi:hypothetical protein